MNSIRKHLGRLFTETLQDNRTGKYSQTKVIAALVAIAATVFMWKLIIAGGMTIEYFICYMAYGSGTASLNKFLDNRIGGLHETRSRRRRQDDTDEDDDSSSRDSAKGPAKE